MREGKKYFFILADIFINHLPLSFVNFILDYVIGSIWDARDFLLEKHARLMPPLRLRRKSSGNLSINAFKKYGEQHILYLKNLCGLKKNAKVLDVGCGCGAIALPLTAYLNQNGSYEGFDIINKSINWCKKNISTRYPNFNFQVIDLYNGKYSPKGKSEASKFKFPYKDNAFDVVFLFSVFTHMLPEDIENYLSEISRVLKRNGKCLITYFLINEVSLALMNKEDFKYIFKKYRTNNNRKNNKTYEDTIAYEESYIRKLYNKNVLKIEQIRYGSWSRRKNILSFQDFVMASKIT